MSAAFAGQASPIPVATRHVEHPLAAQIVTEPAHERPRLR